MKALATLVLSLLLSLNITFASYHHGGKYMIDTVDEQLEFLMRANGDITVLNDVWFTIEAERKRKSDSMAFLFRQSTDEDLYSISFDLSYEDDDFPIITRFCGSHYDRKVQETYDNYPGSFAIYKWNKKTKEYQYIERAEGAYKGCP